MGAGACVTMLMALGNQQVINEVGIMRIAAECVCMVHMAAS